MRFLLDSSVSSALIEVLSKLGHDAVHTRDYDMESVPDGEVLSRAVDESRSGRYGFCDPRRSPSRGASSIILFRGPSVYSPRLQPDLLAANLPRLAGDLADGCVAVITQDRLRVRNLPITDDA